MGKGGIDRYTIRRVRREPRERLEGDEGWTLEMAVSLDSLGYDANTATVDAVQMSICIWDADWLTSPDHIATRAWWANEWGNNGGGLAGRILLRNDVNINTATLPP